MDDKEAVDNKIQSARIKNAKYKICSLEEKIIIGLIEENPVITQNELAEKVGKSERTIKTQMNLLQEKGLLKRVNGKRKGKWNITVKFD